MYTHNDIKILLALNSGKRLIHIEEIFASRKITRQYLLELEQMAGDEWDINMSTAGIAYFHAKYELQERWPKIVEEMIKEDTEYWESYQHYFGVNDNR